MIAAIHQPNFFPWLGYFNKIIRSDKFIILDDVQYPKSGAGTWCNRVSMNINGKKSWITAPIERKSGIWKISETYFKGSDWKGKAWKTIQRSYSRSDYYGDFEELIHSLVLAPSESVVEYNINAIAAISEILNIDFKPKVILQSEFNTENNSTGLLAELTLKSGCDSYLCGGGAGGYQDDSFFKENGINLIYQNFIHPEYPQLNVKHFIEGLSIIDSLFNNGKEKNQRLFK